MKFKKNWRNRRALAGGITGLLLVGGLAGCTTVTPPPVVALAASWDGAEQNSGFLGWGTTTTGNCGIITPHARARYNALIEVYGKKLAPPLTPDYGITATSSNAFLITPEALADFARMNRWRKTAGP